MNWKAHFLFGFFLMGVIAYLLGYGVFSVLSFALFAGVSALVPDLDHEMGKGREILNKIVFPIMLIAVYLNSCGNNFSCVLQIESLKTILLVSFALAGIYFVLFTYLKPKHRGITHSLIFVILYVVFLYSILGTGLAMAGGVGYLSHLISDKKIKLI